MRTYHQYFTLLGIFFLGILGLLYPLQTEAEELPPGMVIGDSEGVNATKNGEYHVRVNDVLPGKTWHTTISMVNMEKDVPYHLTMLISPAVVSGSLDLSQAIQMTLTYEGKIIYEGPASGVSESLNLQTTPLNLGTFRAGDSRALEVTYSLSGMYTKQDFVQKNSMDNVWTYYAVKMSEGTTKPFGRFPSTGEIKQGMIVLCVGLFMVLIALLVWRKKQDQRIELKRKE